MWMPALKTKNTLLNLARADRIELRANHKGDFEIQVRLEQAIWVIHECNGEESGKEFLVRLLNRLNREKKA